MKKILVIDDDVTFATTMREALDATGKYEVTTSNNPRAALDTIDLDTPDVILLDVKMPEMGGIEFLRRLRDSDKGKNVLVVMTTNDSSLDTMSQSAELNVRGYVLKANESLKTIVEMVDRLFVQQ